MTRPSRRGKQRALLSTEYATGVVDGDDTDWDEGGIYAPPPGFDVPAITYGTPAEGTDLTAIRTDATITPPDLDELGDVDTTGVADGDVLTYDLGSTTWVAAAPTGGSGAVATDTIWDAAGDLAVGSGADTAARLPVGSEDDVLTIVSGVPAWAAPATGGGGGGSAGLYGDGIDGNVTIAGAVSLTRDMFYNDLTVNSVLTANNLRIFVKGTLSGSGTIRFNGNAGGNGGNGSSGVGGAAGSAAGALSGQTLPAGSPGTAGRIGGANANPGSVGLNGNKSTMNVQQPNGVAGGASGTGNAGGGGGTAPTADAAGTNKPNVYPACVTFRGFDNSQANMASLLGSACSGGSGGSAASSGGGGSGGSGGSGGNIVICAATVSGTFVIEAKGGNGGTGGNGGGANAGGGAGGNGGSGGTVVMIYGDRSGWSGSIDLSGGTGGNGGTAVGSGVAGTNGNAGPTGYLVEFQM
jgi:hypothetical protein